MPRHLLLLLDFDETLTPTGSDTLSHLAATAYSLQRPPGALQPWDHFTGAYLRDYDAYVKVCPVESRRTLDAERRFLVGLHGVENASVRRVEEAGVFRGLDRAVLVREAAGEVVMREGWKDVVKKGMSRGRVAVVSVNWSRAWIRECLRGEEVQVYANEFVVGEDGRTTGQLDRWFGDQGGVWTAGDKLKVMRDIIHKSGAGEEALVVYVGDSATDLLCLLEADVGVVFGRRLDGVCGRVGIPVKDGLVAGDTGGGKGLRRIEGWGEVDEWLDTV